ncbi:MAG: transposase [Saprospiraceae bacterium]|nr:transposase [Saprospiraceae bacterium]
MRTVQLHRGVVPGLHSSGGTEKALGITPRCRSLLRSYIIEAAWIAMRERSGTPGILPQASGQKQ